MPTIGTVISHPSQGVVGAIGEMIFYAKLVTTTSGTLDTTINTGTQAPAGGSVVKTATKTGRYTFALPNSYRKLLHVAVTPVGPADAAYGATSTGGPDFFIRNDNVSSSKFVAASTQAGTFDLQFASTATNADAELPDGTSVMVKIVVER